MVDPLLRWSADPAFPTSAPWVDNRPGGASCPNWVFLLDQPSPKRVLIVGPATAGTLRWFGKRAVVDRQSTMPVGPPPLRYDLVVVEAGAVIPDGDRPGLVRLADACHERGALRLPWQPTPARRRALELLGFPDVRSESDASPDRARGHQGLVAGRGPTGSPPAWLVAAALTAGVELAEADVGAVGDVGAAARWSIEVPSGYPSRKAVARITGGRPGRSLVVKATRHPSFNTRLDNEARQLTAAVELPKAVTAAMPAMLSSGRLGDLSVVVETALPGRPFLEASSLRPGCTLAQSVADWSTRLAVASASPLEGIDLAGRLGGLLDRFQHHFEPDAPTVHFLRNQVARIAHAGEVPGVLFHGDLGTWNLLADGHRVGVLDWESAEWPGPPLWDLLYFSRSFAVRSGRRRGLRRDLAIRRHLIEGSRLTAEISGWVRTYTTALDLDQELLEPLFHTCWMHRAVKEASRLPEGRTGHYGPLCVRLIRSRHARGIRALTHLARTG